MLGRELWSLERAIFPPSSPHPPSLLPPLSPIWSAIDVVFPFRSHLASSGVCADNIRPSSTLQKLCSGSHWHGDRHYLFLHHHDNGESSRGLGSTTHAELVKWSFLEEIYNATQRNKGVRSELMDPSGSIISFQNTSLLANRFVQNSNSWSRMVCRLLSDHSDFNLYLYFLFVCASSKWNINPLF